MDVGVWKLWLKTEVACQKGSIKKIEKHLKWKVCGGGYQEKVTVLSWVVEFLVSTGGGLMRGNGKKGSLRDGILS